MAEILNVAVFGVGRWGTHLIRNFLAQPQARLVAIVDLHPDRLHTVADTLGLDPDIKLETDWQAVMRSPDLDAIAIATPAATHYPLIKTALEAGLHVLAEKPLTLNPQEAIALCHLADQQQRQLVIDHTYLFHPAVNRGRQAIAQGSIGDLRYGYASRTHLGPVRQDVDALWDLAIHDIAIFNHWLQATPVQVQAQGRIWLQPDPVAGDRFPQGLSDLVWVTLTYASGFQAVIHLCWLNPDKQRRLCVVGSQGTLIFDELAPNSLMVQQGNLEQQAQQFVPVNQAQQVVPFEPGEPLQAVCAHFLQCVQQNQASTISPGPLGADLVKILTALTTSLNRGGESIVV